MCLCSCSRSRCWILGILHCRDWPCRVLPGVLIDQAYLHCGNLDLQAACTCLCQLPKDLAAHNSVLSACDKSAQWPKSIDFLHYAPLGSSVPPPACQLPSHWMCHLPGNLHPRQHRGFEPDHVSSGAAVSGCAKGRVGRKLGGVRASPAPRDAQDGIGDARCAC